MVHADLNCLTVLQYAVEVLKVEHVIVVGHYGCGAVQAVVEQRRTGLAENWLRHLEDVSRKHAGRLDDIAATEARASRLCELNVIDQSATFVGRPRCAELGSEGNTWKCTGWSMDSATGCSGGSVQV